MANVIKIKKGLDINLKGKPQEVEIQSASGTLYGVAPEHYPGLLPKLEVKVGDYVKAGDPILRHKKIPALKITSPVSGKVVDVVRGAKRKILSVLIESERETEYKAFDTANTATMDGASLKALLLEAGLFALIKQRPYDYIADPTQPARDIFISANLTAPLVPHAEVLLHGNESYLQPAIDALAKMTTGSVYVGVRKGSPLKLNNCKVYEIEGPHPAGNVGVLINHTKPVNKGETVWTLGVTELLLIGRFLKSGRVDLRKRIALAGSRLATTGLVTVLPGTEVQPLIADKLDSKPTHYRIVDGDVLTGKQVTGEYRFLSPFSNTICVIPEGDDVNEFFGWAVPGFGKYTMGRTYPTFLSGKKREYDIDARIQGGERAIIVSNEYDKVFPFDIYPEQLIKAIISFDIDEMEALGIYEVAPEDFALCEFADTSKLELQYIVRKGLDELYKEMN